MVFTFVKTIVTFIQNAQILWIMKERIAQIMKRENLTPSSFAESIGIQRSALSHILNGRNKPSLDVIMKIHQTYPYINLDWLLYGKGEITPQDYLNDTTTENSQPSLFDRNSLYASLPQESEEYRKENASKHSENDVKEIIREEVRYIEKPQRKITEIRIFFDDNTFQIFKGES